MQVEPAFEVFEAGYARGEPQLVFTRLVSDLETPVSAFLKLAGNRRNAFLLESVEGGAVRGRYSMLGFDPDLLFRAEGDKAEIARAPDLSQLRALPGGHARRAPQADRREPHRRARRSCRRWRPASSAISPTTWCG